MSTLAVAAACLAPPAASAAPPAPEPERMARDDSALLAFLGGAPLTADEQEQVRAYLADAWAADPERLAKGAAGVRQALALLARHDARGDAAVRESWRPALEALPAGDAERRIVDAHDRVVAFDPAARLIVTERTLDALDRAGAWAASSLGKPPPGPAFRDQAREALAGEFAGMDHANKEAFAHIESNMAAALPALSREPAESRRAALLRWGDADAPAHLARDVASAFEIAAAQARGAGAGGSGGGPGEAALMRSLTDRQMQQSVWSIRHPECGPTGARPSSCGDAPILRPIGP